MASQLRVLQVIDSLARAGAEQSLTALAAPLASEGIEVHVAYLVERDGLRPDLERAGIPVHSLADGSSRRSRWLRDTARLIRELQPAVVHTTLFEADLAGRRAAARLGVPCVSSLVNTAYGPIEVSADKLSRIKVLAAHATDAFTARKVTRFHALTRHVATVMGRRLRIPADRIEVIPRGRDAGLLGRRSAARRAATRGELGIAENTPMVLAVGRQEPQKGLDVLLRAIPAVRDRFHGVRVFIAGREGRASGSLKALASKNDLARTVRFLGERDDVPELMAAADVLAFPSLWEGAGGTLQEAMALECPIVTSALPTILETVDESTAVLATPGRPDELARGLVAVLGDPHGSHERALAARARFERDFTIDVCAPRMADLYCRVAATA
jgi:glycosyltransferase involved in cell wall biosynthesis